MSAPNFYCGRWQCKTCGPRMTEREVAQSKREQEERRKAREAQHPPQEPERG
jgi:ferredoxin